MGCILTESLYNISVNVKMYSNKKICKYVNNVLSDLILISIFRRNRLHLQFGRMYHMITQRGMRIHQLLDTLCRFKLKTFYI